MTNIDPKIRILLLLHRLKSRKEETIELDKRLLVFNAGQKCDMYKGPCACGAWHKPGDIEKAFLEK